MRFLSLWKNPLRIPCLPGAQDFWYSALLPSFENDESAASLAWLRHTGHLVSSSAGRFEMYTHDRDCEAHIHKCQNIKSIPAVPSAVSGLKMRMTFKIENDIQNSRCQYKTVKRPRLAWRKCNCEVSQHSAKPMKQQIRHFQRREGGQSTRCPAPLPTT